MLDGMYFIYLSWNGQFHFCNIFPSSFFVKKKLYICVLNHPVYITTHIQLPKFISTFSYESPKYPPYKTLNPPLHTTTTTKNSFLSQFHLQHNEYTPSSTHIIIIIISTHCLLRITITTTITILSRIIIVMWVCVFVVYRLDCVYV